MTDNFHALRNLRLEQDLQQMTLYRDNCVTEIGRLEAELAEARQDNRDLADMKITATHDELVGVLRGILEDPSTTMQPMRIAAAYSVLSDNGYDDPEGAVVDGLLRQARAEIDGDAL